MRPSSSLFRWLPAAGVLLAAALCAPLAAQVVPDTVRRDSAVVRIPPGDLDPDTLPDKAVKDTVPPDSTLPAASLPAYPREGGGSWNGVWTWTREDLAFYHGAGVLDLLERVPGLLVVRTGSFGYPAGVSSYGLGGGRLRVFMDGWEIQPLASATLDLQQIALGDLEAVRVERGLTETRIYLTTFRLRDRRPFAQVELADGDFNNRILRGFFARQVGERNVVQGLYDLIDTDGFRRQQPYTATTYDARWTHSFGEGRGLQLEFRKLGETRGDDQHLRYLELADRYDLLLRGSWQVGALQLYGVAGRSWRNHDGIDTTSFEGSGTQAGLTAAYALPIGWLSAEARLFQGEGGFAPNAAEVSARADLALTSRFEVAGEVRSLSRGGEAGLEAEGSARFSPLRHLSLFGSLAGGTRGIPFVQDSLRTRRTFGGLGRPVGVDTITIDTLDAFRELRSNVAGFRAGAEWGKPGALLGAALVRSDANRIAAFGLAWDAGVPPVDAGAVTAIEAYANAPLIWDWLRVDGWYAQVPEAGGRPYLPKNLGRVALQYHDVFYTGNLEPTVRLEAFFRGPALTLEPDGRTFGPQTETYAIFNFFLQIRVLDVRAFLLAENLLNRQIAFDVTGNSLPGARTMYGVRWFFRN